jgi:hypothetical protein
MVGRVLQDSGEASEEVRRDSKGQDLRYAQVARVSKGAEVIIHVFL